MNHRFPAVSEAITIHDDQIAQFGGSMGIRDVGALESALFRPQLGYYDSVIEEAAALMESLAMNHPFVDGNKRTAFFATDAFLRMNGYFIDCDSEEAYAFFMQVVRDQLVQVRRAGGLARGALPSRCRGLDDKQG